MIDSLPDQTQPLPPKTELTKIPRFDGKRVLLTGASGFIGRHLARRLLELGAVVHGTTRRSAIEDLDSAVEWHRIDLADADAVNSGFETIQPNIVLHLASHVAGSRDLSLIGPTLRDNLCSTVYLMEAAARLGCDRFVHVGSLEEPDAEDAVAIPTSPYAAAKAAASSYARMFHSLYALPVVTARVFMVYGPGHQDERKLVPYVIQSLIAGDAPSFSSGTRLVDWIHVDDVTEGLLRLASHPGLEGRRIDLGTGELHTVREMVEQIFWASGAETSPKFGGKQDRSSEQIRQADADATFDLLGWRPTISLQQGVSKTIAWFKARSSSS